jgi:hypothetical protein
VPLEEAHEGRVAAENKEPAALAGMVRRRPFSLDRDLGECYTQYGNIQK